MARSDRANMDTMAADLKALETTLRDPTTKAAITAEGPIAITTAAALVWTDHSPLGKFLRPAAEKFATIATPVTADTIMRTQAAIHAATETAPPPTTTTSTFSWRPW